MEVRTGKFKSARHPAETGSSAVDKLGGVLKLAAFLALVGGIFNCYIYLHQKIDETEQAIRKTTGDIEQTGRDIVLLKIQLSKYSKWSYVNRMIEHHHLALQLPQPGQVEILTMHTAPAKPDTRSIEYAGNRLR